MPPSIGQINKRWVSSLDPLLDQVSVRKQLGLIRRDKDFQQLLISTSGKLLSDAPMRRVGNAIYYQYQEGLTNPQISLLTSTVTGSGTASISVTGLPAASQNLLAVNDVLLLPSGGAIQVKTVPSISAFTAISVDGSNVTVTNTQYLTNITNAQESGSSSPANRRFDVSRINNVWQIIRTKSQITDVESVNEIRFEYGGVDRIMYYQSEKLRTRHEMAKNGALYLGRLGSTLFSDASPANAGPNGNGIQMTRGLHQYIETFGVNDAVASLGTVTLADFEDLHVQLLAARSPKDYFLTGSTAVMTKYSNLFKNLASGGVNSVRMIVDGNEVDLDVQRWEYAGFTYNMKSSSFLDNNEFIGSAATSLMPAAKYAVGFPVGYSPTEKGESVPYLGIACPEKMASDAPNRTVRGCDMEINHGALADTATNGDLVYNLEMISYLGLDAANPQSFFRQQVLT